MPDKILVVDDELNIRNLAKMVLEGEGYHVITAADGDEAINKTEAEMPDLILMDVVMPRKSGLDACKALKSQVKTRNIPIVICTVLGRDSDKKLSSEAGADGHFTKPFKSEELITEVKRRLDQSRSEKFSKELGIEHSTLQGKKILFEFDPSTPYERLIRDFALECISHGEATIVLTKKGSAVRQALESEKGVELIDLTLERAQAESNIIQWIMASTTSPHAITVSSILEQHQSKPLGLVFDSLTNIALTTDPQKAYRFTQNAIELLVEPRITAIFLLNPSAHEARDVSSLRGLFSSQLSYGKEGVVGVKII